MAVYASLLSKIPMPEKNWQTKSSVPSVASIKVSDITDSSDVKTCENVSCQNRWIESFRNYFVQKRLKKLENIPEEKRTAVQQAEIEANKQSMNCMV